VRPAAHLYTDEERAALIQKSRSVPFLERFWARVAKRKSGCWEWIGTCDKDGYGRLNFGRPIRRAAAHRLSWEFKHGPILPGFHVLHTCDNPPCVNPAHLRLSTHRENMHDRDAKGRSKVPVRRGGKWTGKVRHVA